MSDVLPIFDNRTIIGTDYGYLHTTGGDVRILLSASNAYRVARNYRNYREGATT